MNKGGQIKQAQGIVGNQINNANNLQGTYQSLLQSNLAARDTGLNSILPGLVAGQGLAQSAADTANTQGLQDTEGLVSRAQQYADQGLTPEAAAALRSNNTQNVPQQFDTANTQLQAALTRRGLLGGNTPASGVAIPQLASLYAARSNAMAGANRDTILQTEQARRQGLAALSQALAQRQAARTQGLSGILGAQQSGQGLAGTYGQIYNPSPYISGTDSALGAAGQATGIRAGLIAPGFMDYVMPLAGSLGGAAITKFCWVAVEIWGLFDLRTMLVRRWMAGPFAKTMLGSVLLSVYARKGQWMADFIKNRPWARRMASWAFEMALKEAYGGFSERSV